MSLEEPHELSEDFRFIILFGTRGLLAGFKSGLWGIVFTVLLASVLLSSLSCLIDLLYIKS